VEIQTAPLAKSWTLYSEKKLQAEKNQENFEKQLQLNSGRRGRPLFSPGHPLARGRPKGA
jgi:hypothetical protein